MEINHIEKLERKKEKEKRKEKITRKKIKTEEI
jgi:hypothetical protein